MDYLGNPDLGLTLGSNPQSLDQGVMGGLIPFDLTSYTSYIFARSRRLYWPAIYEMSVFRVVGTGQAFILLEIQVDIVRGGLRFKARHSCS